MLVRFLVLTAVVTLSLAGSASADNKKKAPLAKPASPQAFHDGDGHYIVVAHDKKKTHVYYGTGKRFYQMVGYTTGARSRAQGVFRLDDPRVRDGELKWRKGSATAVCQRTMTSTADDKVALTELSERETRALVKKASFLPPVKQRRPHLLARDALGIYYYVDRLDTREFLDFRLFISEAGKMRKTPLRNIASDTVGQVFATKKGALQVRRVSKRGLEAYAWVQPNRRDKYELVSVPTRSNRTLIYNTLGVYAAKRLGTFCDDL